MSTSLCLLLLLLSISYHPIVAISLSSYVAQHTHINITSFLPELICLLSTSFQSQYRNDDKTKIYPSCQETSTRWKSVDKIHGLATKGDEYIGRAVLASIWQPEGIHMRVWEAISPSRYTTSPSTSPFVLVLFRHQESSSLLSDEMWEMMSQFGAANMADKKNGNSHAAWTRVVQDAILGGRQKMGFDWFPQSLRMFDAVRVHYTSQANTQFILSGYSSGAYYAQAVAAYHSYPPPSSPSTSTHTPIPAITWAPLGIEDLIVHMYPEQFKHVTKHVNFSSSSAPLFPHIISFTSTLDPTSQMGCHVGIICEWHDPHILHTHMTSTRHGYELLSGIEWLDEDVANRYHLAQIFGTKQDPIPDAIKWTQHVTGWPWYHTEITVVTSEQHQNMMNIQNTVQQTHLSFHCMSHRAYNAIYGSCRRESEQSQQRYQAKESIFTHRYDERLSQLQPGHQEL